jgi:branched-chain amino acid transport system substrate-binding protein
LRTFGTRRALSLTASVAVAAVLAAGCSSGGGDSAAAGSSTADTSVLGPDQKATGTPVKIGLFNVEGGSRVSQPQIGDSAEAAVKYANDHLGGLNGHVIEVVRCGDKADGASAAACGNTFVQDKVAAVVAGQPATADQIVPVVTGAGIPWVGSSPSAASEITSQDSFFFGSGFFGTLAAYAQYSKDKGFKTVTMFGADNPALVASVNAIGKPLFAKVGTDFALVTIPQGTADSTSQIQAGLTRKPDAVIAVADNTVCQSILSALQTSGSTVPKMVNSSCVAQSVIDALGDSGINGSILFSTGDPSGDNQEANLYKAVMGQYAPETEATGITPTGYLSMLGFIRAVNAGAKAPGADVTTAAGAEAALKAAVDVPLPIGDGTTFSCDKSAIPTTLVRSTICTSSVFASTYAGSTPGPYSTIDIAQIFA